MRRIIIYDVELKIFIVEATKVVAGFHTDPLSRQKVRLVGSRNTRVPEEEASDEREEEEPRMKLKANNKLNPCITPSRNQTQTMLIGPERSNHCIIHAPGPFFSSLSANTLASLAALTGRTGLKWTHWLYRDYLLT